MSLVQVKLEFYYLCLKYFANATMRFIFVPSLLNFATQLS